MNKGEIMKYFYTLLLAAALFLVACGDDGSDDFIVKGGVISYPEDDLSSSSGRGRSSSSYYNPALNLDSINKRPPCRTEDVDNCEYGKLVDTRDGQTYKTVVVGEQVWMAENLNYMTDSSGCYEDRIDYCDDYGRLYLWSEAMQVCPAGWHLPSLNEWKALYISAGGLETSASRLRADYDWSYSSVGTDDYGFSVLPGGAYRTDWYNAFIEMRSTAYFWTSTEKLDPDELRMYNICFDKRDEIIDGNSSVIGNMFSVRCVKD